MSLGPSFLSLSTTSALIATQNNLGSHLSDQEIEDLKRYLTTYLSLPFINDVAGEACEEMLALARHGVYQGSRSNRPYPDIVVGGVNYSVKTTKLRANLRSMLGRRQTIITARLEPSVNKATLNDDELGAEILERYNQDRVIAYEWNKIAILLRAENNSEFLYFEENADLYDTNGYGWQDTGRAEAGQKNIAGFDSVGRKFAWTSKGGQFYVDHHVPEDADVFYIDPRNVGIEELAQMLNANAVDRDEMLKKEYDRLRRVYETEGFTGLLDALGYQ